MIAPLVIAGILSWTGPEANCDGSLITEPGHQITEYRILYGTESRGSVNLATSYPVNAGCDSMVKLTDLDDANFSYADEIPIVDGTVRAHDIDFLDPGTYYFTMYAINANGDMSPLSNEVGKVIAVGPMVPFILSSAACEDCPSIDGQLLVGETGKPVTLQWNAPGVKRVEVLEYNDTVPVAAGDFNGSTWTFTPTKAGLFYTRVRTCDTCEWMYSDEQGFMYYFKLAAPTGGGID